MNEVNWERPPPAPNNRTDKQGARLSLCRRHGKNRLGEAGLFAHNRQLEPCRAVCLPCHVFLLLLVSLRIFPATGLLFNWFARLLVGLPAWNCPHQPALVLYLGVYESVTSRKALIRLKILTAAAAANGKDKEWQSSAYPN